MVTVVKSTPYDLVISRADAELAALEKSQDEIRAQVATTRNEITAIQAQANSRNAQLATLRQEVKALENTHDQVDCELNLAEHTNLAAGLSATLKRIKAELQAKRSKIADLEKNAFAEEAKDAAQLQRLESALVEHEKRLAEITQRRQAIAAVKEKTFLAQGQAEIEAVKARLAELHRLLEAAQKAEQSTRDALLRFSDEAQQRLAPWPTLVQQVQQQLSYEDASTRILTLAIELHQALIEQGKGADIHPDILRQAGMWGSSLVSEIALEVQNLWPAVTHNGNPESLINQERRLSKLLATYIDVKR